MDTRSIPVSYSYGYAEVVRRVTRASSNNVVYLLVWTGDPRVSVLEDLLPDGVRSTLVIREAQDKYFGSYNCSVANAYGMDAAEIQLKKQSNFSLYFSFSFCVSFRAFSFSLFFLLDFVTHAGQTDLLHDTILSVHTESLPLLVILSGIVGGVVIIIACAMVVILCHRRNANKKGQKGKKEKKKKFYANASFWWWTNAVCHFGTEGDKVAGGDRTSKQSDQTSNNDSDLKVDIRTASSLSNPPESEHWDDSSDRITPRAVIANGGDPLGPYHHHRYGMTPDYADGAGNFQPPTPLKAEGHNNNGYVPYVDYNGRDYNPSFGKRFGGDDATSISVIRYIRPLIIIIIICNRCVSRSVHQ